MTQWNDNFHAHLMAKVDLIIRYAGRPGIDRPVMPDDDRDILGETYARARGKQWYEDFAKFTGESPVIAQQLEELLNDAADGIDNEDQGAIHLIARASNQWKGTAGENFNEYVGELADATGLHVGALQALGRVAKAHGESIDKMHKDVERIADATIEVLQFQKGGNDRLKLMVAGTVLGALAVAAPPAAAAVIGTMLGAAQLIAENTTSAEVGGSSQLEKLKSMEKALTQLEAAVKVEQTRLQRALQKFRTHLAENISDIMPNLPNITGRQPMRWGNNG